MTKIKLSLCGSFFYHKKSTILDKLKKLYDLIHIAFYYHTIHQKLCTELIVRSAQDRDLLGAHGIRTHEPRFCRPVQ